MLRASIYTFHDVYVMFEPALAVKVPTECGGKVANTSTGLGKDKVDSGGRRS